MRGALVPALALLAGCGASEGFGRLGPFKLQSGVISLSNGADTVLRYETASRGCQVLASDFSVTVDGTPIPAIPGARRSDPTTGGELCDPPKFTVPRPLTFGGDPVNVEARSGDDVLTAQLDGLGMDIRGTPLPFAEAIPHLGETIRIALGPGWDRLTWPETGILSTDSSLRVSAYARVKAPVDGVLEVTLPATYSVVLAPTETVLQVWARGVPRFTSCDAPLGCAIGTDVTGLVVRLKLSLVIQP